MTDKEKIRVEIERLISRRDEKTFLGIEKISALKEVLSFIESMQEESVSEELVKCTSKIILEGTNFNKSWYAHPELAFKAGAKWQMAQMIKDAFECKVKVDAGGYPYIPQMELYDYDKDVPLAKEGDRYKVILIKED